MGEDAISPQPAGARKSRVHAVQSLSICFRSGVATFRAGGSVRRPVTDHDAIFPHIKPIHADRQLMPRRSGPSLRRVSLAPAIAAALALGGATTDARAQSFAPTMSLSTLDGSNGFRIAGSVENGRSGRSVSRAGDINGDGIDDLIVGGDRGNFDDESPRSGTYVVFGRSEGDSFASSISETELDGSNGFRIDVAPTARAGRAVSFAGDINGDGIDDLIIGTPYASPGGALWAGSSYVLFGHEQSRPFTSSIELTNLDGTNGFRIDGVSPYDYSGIAVSAAGDINDDGIDDLLIGAWGLRGAFREASHIGAGYVLFGRAGPTAFTSPVALSALAGTDGFRLRGESPQDFTGLHVGGAGDLNGDGIDDLVVGAIGADPAGQTRAGSAYIVFGRDAGSGFPASISPTDLDGSTGFRLDGDAIWDSTGSADGAGDINGDGMNDLIVGAQGADPGGMYSAGSTYVVFGRSDGATFTSTLSPTNLDGTTGFKLNGASAHEYSGYAASTAGDVNGDGIDDLVIGAPFASPEGRIAAGSSYVVFGRRGVDAFPTSMELVMLDGSNGFRLDGEASGDQSGNDVGAAGDINGDGVDDLIIGALGADSEGVSDSGRSYVVFGRIGQAMADMSSTELDFGRIGVGLQSPVRTLTLFSTGTARLDVTAIEAIGGAFTWVGGSCPMPPFRLVFDGECTLELQFSPSTPGSASAVLTIHSSGIDSPEQILLTGTGIDGLIFVDGFEHAP